MKSLHNDLYNWLSSLKLAGNLDPEIFTRLGVDVADLAGISAIDATLLVEKSSLERITSKMEK